jgi:hypothetical protein
MESCRACQWEQAPPTNATALCQTGTFVGAVSLVHLGDVNRTSFEFGALAIFGPLMGCSKIKACPNHVSICLFIFVCVFVCMNERGVAVGVIMDLAVALASPVTQSTDKD